MPEWPPVFPSAAAATSEARPTRRLTVRRTGRDLLVLLGSFAAVSAIAAAAGAANFGTALAFGQIGFAAALVWVLLTR
jgi:hypothetical protein